MTSLRSGRGTKLHADLAADIAAALQQQEEEEVPFRARRKSNYGLPPVEGAFLYEESEVGSDKVEEDAKLTILQDHYGIKLLIMICVVHHLVLGFANNLCSMQGVVKYIFAVYDIDATRSQLFTGIAEAPYAMKPLIGLVSDRFPLGGYHKLPYMFVSVLLGIVGCGILAFLPQELIGERTLVLSLFLMQLTMAVCELLTDSKYAEKTRTRPSTGPIILTFIWMGNHMGGLLAIVLAAPVMESWGLRAPFLICLVPLCTILVPLLANFLNEVPKSPLQLTTEHLQLSTQKEVGYLCIMLFVSSLALFVISSFCRDVAINAAVALNFAVLLLIGLSITLRPVIAKVSIFFFLQTTLHFQISGAAFYFLTDSPEQFPGGPHFSVTFFNSYMGGIRHAFALLGLYTYQRYAMTWYYRSLIFTTTLVSSFLGLLDTILYSRVNLRWGIPDHVFMFGNYAFNSVVRQWMWMPGVVMMAQMCPPGLESTMLALLAGCHAMGQIVQSAVGAWVLHLLGCHPNGDDNEGEEFRHLWVASLLSVLLPLVTLALLPWLIPDAKQNDRLIVEHNRDATEGSLLRRWRGF